MGNILLRFINLILYFFYALNLKLKKSTYSVKTTILKSSISDDGVYPTFCLEASKNSKIFKSFRRHPDYRAILEHVTYQQGLDYIKEIDRLEHSYKIKGIESKIGNPFMYLYKDFGWISPTTLRYVKVFAEINSIFGKNTCKSICEVGGGYGGQARIFSIYQNIDKYVIYDLPEVNLLVDRFIQQSLGDENIFSRTDEKIQEDYFDLFISNYAFSELNKSLQDTYMVEVISKSIRGYITFNYIHKNPETGYTADEISNRIPNSEIIFEKPLTHNRNVIIIWGHR